MPHLTKLAALAFVLPFAGGTAFAQATSNTSGVASQANPSRDVSSPATLDTNNDGKADAWDRDSNGAADAWDKNGDGKPDAFDDDGDGKPDKTPR